jgi:hypothetical protein
MLRFGVETALGAAAAAAAVFAILFLENTW